MVLVWSNFLIPKCTEYSSCLCTLNKLLYVQFVCVGVGVWSLCNLSFSLDSIFSVCYPCILVIYFRLRVNTVHTVGTLPHILSVLSSTILYSYTLPSIVYSSYTHNLTQPYPPPVQPINLNPAPIQPDVSQTQQTPKHRHKHRYKHKHKYEREHLVST